MDVSLDTKKDIFLKVEKQFTDELHSKVEAMLSKELSFCCDEVDEESMINMADIIKGIPKYSILSFRDIYFVLIYIYYSLRFNEQTEDWLDINFLQRNVLNKPLALDLYYNITTGDIIANGQNLSSAIRRYVLEIRGGKKRKLYKTMRRKSRKSRKSRKPRKK
jgi:hypothetical protein